MRCQVQGKGPEALSEQKFVVCGAGSAASGVLLTIRNAITRRCVVERPDLCCKIQIYSDYLVQRKVGRVRLCHRAILA